MNNIERIIRYLSNEMEKEEQQNFKELLASDPDLMEEYRSILRIWEIAKEKLTLDDLPEGEDREELIAAVIAASDVQFYGTGESAEDELNFQSRLKEIIAEKDSEKNKKPGNSFPLNYKTGLLLAAAIALLFLIFRPSVNLKEQAISYYDPSNDPLLELYSLQTRSDDSKALQMVKQRKYETARNFFETNQETINQNDVAALFYAVTCYETGNRGKAFDLLTELSGSGQEDVSYHATWYLALFYIDQDQKEMALPYLERLSEKEGIFKQKTRKLIRKSGQ
ncbi:MAG: hypothetical protein WD577_11695 [Bacteroidales bacterium]